MKTAGKWMVLVLAAGTAAAQAAPKTALFVQNRAGAPLEAQLDAFNDLVGSRLTDAGFEVIRPQDALDRFAESRSAEESHILRQSVETLQTAKSEGTVDGPSREAAALRVAQAMGADYLVFASLVSLGENQVNITAYELVRQQTVTTLRMALRVLEGVRGAQIYGDTIAVNEKIAQNANLQVQAGDLVNTLLDRGAAELAARVGQSVAKIAAPPAEAAWVAVTVTTAAAGAAVEVDGIVVGTAPGQIRVRTGVHQVRVTREGYATWEKSVAFHDGQTLDIPMELSGTGLARKGELEAQAIAREQSAADAQATVLAASNSYIRLEGMPAQSLSIGDTGTAGADSINVIQQK